MLLDAQLFGRSNVRNGYLRATMSRRKGIVGTADGGSLFVEQIQNTTPGVQAKLLELITGGRIHRFRANRHYVADVRLIASARRVWTSCESGLFLPQLWAQLRRRASNSTEAAPPRKVFSAVIDRLARRSYASGPQAASGRVTECWTMAERSASRLTLAPHCVARWNLPPNNVPVPFHRSGISRGTEVHEPRPRRIARCRTARLSGGLFDRNGRYLHARATGHAYCLVPDISQSSPVMSLVVR